jgi:4-hydroxybenzoate polyprenyltransferase
MRHIGVFRGDVWWVNKLAPLLGTAYAAAVVLRIPVATLCPLLLTLLFALVPCAAYVSVLNDITDLGDDLRCGKSNRLAGLSPRYGAVALGGCMLFGLLAGLLLRLYPWTRVFYAGNWIAYTFYSAPPLRLKTRGGWGLLMDACGAHLLPALWATSLIAEATGQRLPLLFVAAVGVWSLSLGIRGILRHEMMDRDRDRQVGLRTFAARVNPRFIERLVGWGIFPAELAGLGALLAQAGTAWPWTLLALNQFAEWLRSRYLGMRFITVGSGVSDRFILAEYYELFYPLTFLLILAQREPTGWSLAGIHLLLFSRPVRLFCHELLIVCAYLAHPVSRPVVRWLRRQ